MAYSCSVCGVISEHPRCSAHQFAPKASNGKGTSWNGTRDRATQAAFRRMLIQRDGHQCRECGTSTDTLQAHHDTPTDGRLLCKNCHRDADDHAR